MDTTEIDLGDCCVSGPAVSAWEYGKGVTLTIDLDREGDGRWIAEALELPGVLCYGQTRGEAISNAEHLAIEVITDRIAHGELPSSALGVSFTIPDEQPARQ
jgi:predicted RNase H-like HicB family nuclease